ncbi:MAG: Gldg family protein [Steroidobacteraceae bacterium]
MNKRTIGIGTLLALGLLFIGITMLANTFVRGPRIDLTANKLYTIAPGTRKILADLHEPVTLTLFSSEKAMSQAPALKTYAVRVREFLEEMRARSNGKLRLEVVDPEPFSEDEDRATELGIRAVPLNAGGENLYFGVAGSNATDGRAAIEFLDPSKEEFLEYDVAKLIYQLATVKKTVVGWLSSLPMAGGMDPMTGQPSDPWFVMLQARELFSVRNLDMTMSKIDPDVDVLVLVHPKNLPPPALFAIDQYALRGGHILVFVDPDASQDQSGDDPNNPMAAMGADRSSTLGPLFKSWGIRYEPGEVVVDLEHGLTVGMRPGEPPVRHIGILGLDASSFNTQDVITAGLSSVNLATAGSLAALEGATTQFEPLLQSSTQAGVLPVERFKALFDPGTLRDGFKPTGLRYALGARVTGSVKTAFPDGAPAGVSAPSELLQASSKPLNVIVIADTDMLADYLWLQQRNFFGQRMAQAIANNGDLVSNALDNLAGSSELISVRGRAAFARPFDRVDALRRTADDRFRAKEQELEEQLRSTEERLTALQSAKSTDSAAILTPAQQAELERFQQEKVRIRKELRQVRLGLDQDIQALGARLKLLNIVIVPGLLALAALAVVGFRRRRRAAIVMLQKEQQK